MVLAELTAASMSETRPRRHARWTPSLTEVVFVSLLGWLFLAGAGAVSLLGDGDTGWHIRTGEHILANRQFPTRDLFSFSRAGEPWFAWEWLSDVLFAVSHMAGGLLAIVLLAGVIIASTSAVLFRHMLWRGANLVAAVVVMLAASSAANIHWLARPHVFTYLFLAIAVWWLEADRRRQSPWVFGLLGLCILWTNLHGGFPALIVTLGVYFVGSVMETFWTPANTRSWNGPRRYALLLGLSVAATLVNPYGYQLHKHIFSYLRSDFILKHVMEFQAPDFRGESMHYFEVLLFAGLASVPALLRRRDITMALLIVVWAHAALVSARHVLLYLVVAAPVVAQELTALWDRAAEQGSGWLSTLREVARDYGAGRFGASGGPAVSWLAPVSVAVVGIVLYTGQHRERLRAEFSDLRFPVKACEKAGDELAGRRIFTSDQWGDYLIYRYYPRLKVFFDGRSDFYGPELGKQYLQAMNSDYRWAEIFNRYNFDLALLPTEWPLATTIKGHPDWKVRYDDGKALLMERIGEGQRESAAAHRVEPPPQS